MRRRSQRALVGVALVAFVGVAVLARRAAAASQRAAGGGSPPPAAPPSSPPELPRMLSAAATDALFGPMPWQPVPGNDSAILIDPAWKASHLVQIEIPQLKGIPGAPASGRVTLHRDIAPRVAALFAAWESAGLLPRVLSWDGSFSERRIRGKTSVSKHAYGIAFDINARWNALGTEPVAAGVEGSVRELVELAAQNGFAWGGNFRGRPDGMHFEAFRKD